VIAGIVLAAGASRRFGAVKQLVELDGTSLLGHAIDAMGEVKEVDEVVVVLGANAQAIMQITPLGRARVVVCRAWDRGLSASLRAGLDAVGHADAVVVTLADQPLVGAAAIRRVIELRDPAVEVAAASFEERPGHPVLLERSSFSRVRELEGEQGAETLLEDGAAKLVRCDDVACSLDVDVPADLARLRRAQRAVPANDDGQPAQETDDLQR
jgi:CTP:molybdopterin cytidylyltransferase MocA